MALDNETLAKIVNIAALREYKEKSDAKYASDLSEVSTELKGLVEDVQSDLDNKTSSIESEISDINDRIDNINIEVDSSTTFKTSNIVIDVEGTTAVDFGLLEAGTEIYGKTLSQLIILALFGEQTPTLAAPSVTVVLDKTYGMYGSEFSTTGTVYFDRGSIDPAFGTSGYRSGLPTSYIIDGETTETEELQLDFTLTISSLAAGENTVSIKVNYAAGDQPLKNTGETYGTALKAGSISKLITITGITTAYVGFSGNSFSEAGDVSAVFFDNTDTGEGAGYEVTVADEDTGDYQAVSIPSSFTLYGIKLWDELTQAWHWMYGSAEDSLAAWYVKTETEYEIDGTTVAYTTYSSDDSTEDHPIGSRRLRFYVVAPEE